MKHASSGNRPASSLDHGSIWRSVYPFSAIVGQEPMKKALLLNAIMPSIGGVLIRGEKGTAKSTAARALAALLPEEDFVTGCPNGCDPKGPLCPDCTAKMEAEGALPFTRKRIPLVDLPLGATEDRVSGSIDMETAIKDGIRAFMPGLLAEAHRGILYVDEVNLLNDHIVDIILDAAAMGHNVVEREGISWSHPSGFILIGTMNPEEGELRPQLLDRFGLCVDASAPTDVDTRLMVLRQRERFDMNPELFISSCKREQEALAERIIRARSILKDVDMNEALIGLCSSLSLEANVAGHRADIIMQRTARAIAALDGRDRVTEEDVHGAANLVLPHRARTAPPPPPEPEHEHEHEHEQDREHNQDQEKAEQPEQQAAQGKPKEDEAGDEGKRDQEENEGKDRDDAAPANPGREEVFPMGEPFKIRAFPSKRDRVERRGSGRRTRSRTTLKSGRYVKSRQDESPTDLALDATLRAAAPYQGVRDRSVVAVAIEDRDMRKKVREKRVGNLIVFVVDASGSMGAGKRMIETKGAVLSLLLDAYQKRDKVSLVAFRGEEADVLLPPTGSVELAYKLLEELPTGGKTPLSHGMTLGYQVLDTGLRKDPDICPLFVLISDGKANVSLSGEKPVPESMDIARRIGEDGRIRSIVIDVERQGIVNFGLAAALSTGMGGSYYRIEDLRAETIVDLLKQEKRD